MAKTKQRPKSKEEKLRERRKHFLDEPVQQQELFLDKGGEEDPQSDDDDDMPEEISTKKSEQKEFAPLREKKKAKKRRIIKKEGPGIYEVQTEDVKLKVVAAATTPAPSQMLQPSINFREMLLQESTKAGRQKDEIHSKHIEKWIKRRR